MRSLTGRVQHRAMLLDRASEPRLVLQVEESYDLMDDYGTRQQWRDAKVEDLAHLPDIYNVNKETP